MEDSIFMPFCVVMQHTIQSGCSPDVLLLATALTSGRCSKGSICNSQIGKFVSVLVSLTENCSFASEVRIRQVLFRYIQALKLR